MLEVLAQMALFVGVSQNPDTCFDNLCDISDVNCFGRVLLC